MEKYLDLDNWARRDLFEFFRGYDKPYFNICTRVEVTHLLALVRLRSNLSVSLAYHYFALRVANEIEPFRYRLREGKVIVHHVVHGGTTVLLPNESFTFATFNNKNNINPLSTPGNFNFDGFLRQGVGDPGQLQLAVKLTF